MSHSTFKKLQSCLCRRQCEWLQEVFEVVDEANNTIGRALRSEVHRLGLLHRAVHVLVFNSKSQLLLQQRSPRQVPVWCNLVFISRSHYALSLSCSLLV